MDTSNYPLPAERSKMTAPKASTSSSIFKRPKTRSVFVKVENVLMETSKL